MLRIFALVPSGHDVGLTSVSLGVYKSLVDKGYSTAFLKPISQPHSSKSQIDQSAELIKNISGFEAPQPIKMEYAEHLLSIGHEQELMEEVVDLKESISEEFDFLIVEAMVPSKELFYTRQINQLMVQALDAEVILVSSQSGKSPEDLSHALEIQIREYNEKSSSIVAGCILNKVGKPHKDHEASSTVLHHTKIHHFGQAESNVVSPEIIAQYEKACKEHNIPLIASIPWDQDFVAPRLIDLAKSIEAHALRRGHWKDKRVESVALCTMSVTKSLYYFRYGALVITTGDRTDIILAASLAYLNGVKIAGILLCGGFEPDPNVMILCEKAFSQGLPLLSVGSDLFKTSIDLSQTSIAVPHDDKQMATKVVDTIEGCVKPEWLESLPKEKREHRISPPEFRNSLIKLAQKNIKRIVLPEGNELRTLRAAIACAQRNIAIPVLLGDPEEIKAIALENKLELHPNIEILTPESQVEQLVEPMVELRKKKGLTPKDARVQLQNPMVVGTMLLKLGLVDGLVAGALGTTADTVRPALQLIKTQPNQDLISSIFFMCLPNQVLVYGDCAINQDPTAEQLAQIAIQSADSAKAFNIPQRVAMISYSTGSSGNGDEVQKVKKATDLVKELRPDILVDGPLQYDAATTESVAVKKAPDSPVAGKATVLVFPDLNTGNTTYKAVQRSANCISIGPMLQGLAKPVNDLSRGALVDDIIYTIALTSIQAEQISE
jgi:phosphate acetyltransferase